MASAEILSIGTELLLGDILDTNSQFISQELALLGINCLHRTTVGDNRERIIENFRLALNRADLVISTGGLGPTPDDLTHECLAALVDGATDFDQQALDRIEQFFKVRGAVMVDSNRKQAYRPRGAGILPNPVGTAPGIIWEMEADVLSRMGIQNPQRKRFVLTFPGVPSEMKSMWAQTARGFLARQFEAGVLWSCELKHYGIGESALAEQYADLLDGSNPTVAPYAGTGECRLRVTAKATSVEEAQKIAQPVIDQIRRESKHLCYGVDRDSLESVIAAELRRRGKTVSVAESCTGGLLSKRLTDIAGSSAYVKLNVVTYANEAKEKLLGVPAALLAEHGAVSAECAESMAIGIKKLSGADFAISVTGIAGPDGGSEEKPVGTVFFGLAANGKNTVLKRRFPEQLGREGIRYRSASEALNFLRLYLLDPRLLDA